MKTGIILPQFDAGPDELLGAARLAEESGLDSVWVFDNLWGVPERDRPVLEAWTSLATVAAATTTITVGTLVLRTTIRNRRVLLAMTESLEMVAPGRVILGLGTGDARTREEQLAYGLEYPPPAKRVADLERHLELFSAELPQVPVWIGGESRNVMSLIPRAAGWNYWGPVAGFASRVHRARALAGNRPVELSWGGPKITPDQLAELAALGAEHAIVAAGSHNYRAKIAMLAEFQG